MTKEENYCFKCRQSEWKMIPQVPQFYSKRVCVVLTMSTFIGVAIKIRIRTSNFDLFWQSCTASKIRLDDLFSYHCDEINIKVLVVVNHVIFADTHNWSVFVKKLSVFSREYGKLVLRQDLLNNDWSNCSDT